MSCRSSWENLKAPILKLWKYIPGKDGTSCFVPKISTETLRSYHPPLSCINNSLDGAGVALKLLAAQSEAKRMRDMKLGCLAVTQTADELPGTLSLGILEKEPGAAGRCCLHPELEFKVQT